MEKTIKLEVTLKEAEMVLHSRIVTVRGMVKAFVPAIIGFLLMIILSFKVDPESWLEWALFSTGFIFFLVMYFWSYKRADKFRKIAKEKVKELYNTP